MNRKYLFGLIIVLTILIIISYKIFSYSKRYNKFIIDDNKWNTIIGNRHSSTSLHLEIIKFNNYNLIIDNDAGIIYYSIVDTKTKNNPLVKYKSNRKINLVIKNKITNDSKIMIYNDRIYRIYSLVITEYPTLNITYKINSQNNNIESPEFEFFDNRIGSSQRVIKSIGRLKVMVQNQKYKFSLEKDSLGHNRRDNYISIFGMPKEESYIIQKADEIKENGIYVQLFLNNKYSGLYTFYFKEERGTKNFERNKKNNN